MIFNGKKKNPRKKRTPIFCINEFGYSIFKVNGPFVQTLCIEKDSYMEAI